MSKKLDFDYHWQHQQGAMFLKEKYNSLEMKKSLAEFFYRMGSQDAKDECDKEKLPSLLGKYVETSPEIYADDCNDFGGSRSGDDIRKIRIASYKQGFFDCEMANGPSRVEQLTKALEVAKGALKSIKQSELMNERPDHEIRHALIVEVPHEANEALEQIKKIEKGE